MEAAKLGKFGKMRSPLAVALLSFFTLGIYFVYWYYMVNREMNDFDPNIRSSPGISALAITLGYLALGVLLLFGIVSSYNTARRANLMFRDFNSSIRTSPIVAAVLYALGGLGFPMLAIFYPAYLQSQLNDFWREQAARAAAAPEERRAA